MKIIVIDDSRELNDSISDYFRICHVYHVISILNGDEAKRLADAHIEDLQCIFVDRHLLTLTAIADRSQNLIRDGDGLVKALEFRRDSRYTHIPIVLYSRMFINNPVEVSELEREYQPRGIFVASGASGPCAFNAFCSSNGLGPWC